MTLTLSLDIIDSEGDGFGYREEEDMDSEYMVGLKVEFDELSAPWFEQWMNGSQDVQQMDGVVEEGNTYHIMLCILFSKI